MQNSAPRRTLIFAHRGANREAAENSRAAFDRALNFPIDGIETDVQLSRDNVPVLWHDRFLDKIGLPDKRIDDFDYADLVSMDFGAFFGAPSKPQRILRLADFIEAYGGRCRLLIEVKNRAWEPNARHESKIRQTLQFARAAAAQSQILISSFNLQSLQFANNRAGKIPLVHNLETDQSLDDARRILQTDPYLYGLCVPIKCLDAPLCELLHHQGKRIAVYTCNSDDEIRKALALAVDILITDLPQRALEMRGP